MLIEFDPLLFPLPLPRCANVQPRAALSEAESAEREAGQINKHHKSAVLIRVAEQLDNIRTPPAPKDRAFRCLPAVSFPTRIPKLATGKFGQKRPFLLTVNGRFLFGKSKRKWGFMYPLLFSKKERTLLGTFSFYYLLSRS